jgi:hypothetical protein
MNYFAHGHAHLDDPYFLAGTAVPDWLNVVNRRAKVRRKTVLPFVESSDLYVASIARGVAQHHRDDAWFHQSRCFAELSLQITVAARDALDRDAGFRPSFLGHILVEILLDAQLIGEQPLRLQRYYDALSAVDPVAVGDAVGRMAGQPLPLLAAFIPRFIAERFLPDYLDDEKLLGRLNQVMRRVNLPPLPAEFCEILPAARRQVAARKHELLTPPDESRDYDIHP